MNQGTVSEETARRIAAALEEQTQLLKQLVAGVLEKDEPVSYPNAPALPKRGAGRGR